uniref:Uncharacterized protein n=1 Tax=Caenorhabditis japonica TaxID=281687 RepID=A0A8R1IXH1_CAEJA
MVYGNLGLNKLASRPNSRISAAIKKTSVSSLPTSARSEGKSSPVPVKDCVPAPTRHKNKGLEMSSAMMDIFGGGGGSSSFPAPPAAVENRDSTPVNRANAGQNLSQPGPEWFEGFDRMDMTGIGK